MQLAHLSDLEQKMQIVVTENDQLHKSLGDGFEGLLHKTEKSRDEAGLGLGAAPPEIVQEMQERVDLLMKENANMMAQWTTMNNELERASTELTESHEKSHQLEQALSATQATALHLEESLDELRREKVQCEERFLQHSGALTTTQTQLEEMKEGMNVLRSQNELFAAQVEEKNKMIQELEERSEADNEELWQRIQALSSRTRELQGMLASKTQEAESANENVRKLARDLETTRSDNEGMLQVMSGMEKQLNDFAAREESVAQVARDSKEKVENALLARDKAVAREVQSRQELARLLESRRKDSEEQEQQHESAVSALRVKFSGQLQEREKEYQTLSLQHTDMSSKMERLVREKRHAETQNQKAQEALGSERAQIEQRCAELRARVISAEETMLSEQSSRHKLEQTVMYLKSEKQRSETTWQQRTVTIEDQLRKCDAQIAALQEQHRTATGMVEAKEKQLERLKKQRDEEVSELTKRQAEELRLKATDSERWEKQTRALDTELKALDSQLQQHHRKHDVAIETLKTDKDAVVAQLEHKRQEEQSSAVQLVTQNRELELQVAQMAVQISESRVIVADTQEEATQLEAMLRESERRCSELAHQLARSLTEQEHLATREARLAASAGTTEAT